MRSRILTTLAFLVPVLAAPAAAQVPVQYGVMAGASFANFRGADAGNSKTRTGFAAGAFLRFHTGIFAIEPQALYVQKGAKADIGTSGSGTFKLDYLEVPVLVKVMISTADAALTPNIFAGPAIAFKANCQLKGDNGSGSSVQTSCSNAGVPVKSTDFSLVLGAGLDVRRLSFQGRYDLGLTKIDDSAAGADIKNGAFLITVGFSF